MTSIFTGASARRTLAGISARSSSILKQVFQMDALLRAAKDEAFARICNKSRGSFASASLESGATGTVSETVVEDFK